MTKLTTTWSVSTGAIVTVTAELITEKSNNCDGHIVTTKCCESNLSIHLEGHGEQGTNINKLPKPVTRDGKTFTMVVGKLGLTDGQYALIEKMRKQIDDLPEMQAKIAKDKENQAEYKKMHNRRMANGYCEKCGSYCFGDCNA